MTIVVLFLFTTVFTTWRMVAACSHYHDSACLVTDPLEGRHFMNQWIVNIEGGSRKARSIAKELGFEYMKKMRTHDDHYFFRHPTDVPHRHKMRHRDVLERLKSHKDIISSDQQYVFELTLNEIDNFEDMVGHSEPLHVEITHYNPDDELNEEEDKPNYVYDGEERTQEDIEIIYGDDDDLPKEKSRDEEDKLSNIDRRTKLETDLLKKREELEKLERQVDKALEKLEDFK